MKKFKGRAVSLFDKGVLFATLILLCLISARADDLRITAKPGQVYNLPANLNDTHIIIEGSGSAGAPFTVTGIGSKTELNGASSILITGDYIVVKNISFNNNIINFRECEGLIQVGSKRNSANNNIIRNCNFSYNGVFPDQDKVTQFYWVELSGRNNLVDNCIFEGKQNRLPVLHVNAFDWRGDDNTISNCTFKNVKPRKGEALEAIRVGFGNSRSDCKILSNSFINYSGDSETISCKSDGVVIDGNTFNGCRSGVSLRLSDSSTIVNNKFKNTIWPVRVSGTGHTINNNVFDSPSSSISFMKGGPGCSYKAVDNINIKDNIFIGQMDIKVIQNGDCGEQPKNVRMLTNYLYKDKLYKVTDGEYGSIMSNMLPDAKTRTDGMREFKYNIKKFNPSSEIKMLKKVTDYQNLIRNKYNEH